MLLNYLSCTWTLGAAWWSHTHTHTPTHTNCHAEGVLSKSDISLHSGIKALCRRADTWSLSPCQRGPASGLRCLEELGEFTPPASRSLNATTVHRLLEVQARTVSAALCHPHNPRIIPYTPYRQTHTHTHTHTHTLRKTHTMFCNIAADLCTMEHVPDNTHTHKHTHTPRCCDGTVYVMELN